MNSRMDKYYNSSKQIGKRSQKNEQLYKEVNKQSLEDFNVNSNVSVLGDNGKTIDLEMLKSMLDKRYKQPEIKKKIELDLPEDDDEISLEQTREYDINAILEKAHENNVCKNEKEFVKLMNQKALELGMKNTIFFNPHGLEEDDGNGNTSTAYDMAILMANAMNNKEFANITKTKSYTVKTNKKTYVWKNKNKLLNTYQYTTGGKTGFTKKARRTLVSSASKDHKKLIVVTLNDPNDFNNHKNLYEEYFKKYDLVKIIDHKKYKLKNKNFKKNLIIKNDIKVLLTKNEKKNIKININLNKQQKFSNNNQVGYLSITLNNKEIAKENIYLENEKKNNKQKKNIFSKIKSWFS